MAPKRRAREPTDPPTEPPSLVLGAIRILGACMLKSLLSTFLDARITVCFNKQKATLEPASIGRMANEMSKYRDQIPRLGAKSGGSKLVGIIQIRNNHPQVYRLSATFYFLSYSIGCSELAFGCTLRDYSRCRIDSTLFLSIVGLRDTQYACEILTFRTQRHTGALNLFTAKFRPVPFGLAFQSGSSRCQLCPEPDLQRRQLVVLSCSIRTANPNSAVAFLVKGRRLVVLFRRQMRAIDSLT